MTDKVAVVTGAASGIGLAIAREVVARGGRVVLLDRDPAVTARAAELGGEAIVRDVSDRAGMKSAAADLQMRHRAVHLLVNNAGVSVAGRFEETSDEDMEWLFGVNYWGVVNGCRAFLPLLRGQPGAHIVNVCSSFAWLGVPGKSAYASSKAAVRAFSESLRAELRGEVGVTLLFPGPVDTNLVRRGRSKSAAQRDAEARFLASRALPTERVAKRCLDGVARDKARVVVGLDDRLLGAAGEKNAQLVAGVHALAARWGTTPSQLAIGWALAKEPRFIPTLGIRTLPNSSPKSRPSSPAARSPAPATRPHTWPPSTARTGRSTLG